MPYLLVAVTFEHLSLCPLRLSVINARLSQPHNSRRNISIASVLLRHDGKPVSRAARDPTTEPSPQADFHSSTWPRLLGREIWASSPGDCRWASASAACINPLVDFTVDVWHPRIFSADPIHHLSSRTIRVSICRSEMDNHLAPCLHTPVVQQLESRPTGDGP
jgi:hypothetical protein